MAPRKTSKTAKNVTEGMEMILSTEPLKTIDEAAQYVGISGFELQEKLAETLNMPQALTWETVPAEYNTLLTELKAQTNGTQALPETSQSQLEPPQTNTNTQVEEIPIQAKEQPQKGGKLAKNKGTKLTKGKTEKLENSDEKSKELNSSQLSVNEVLHARKGQKNGARLATIELVAEDATYRKTMSEALKRKTAQLASEVSAEEGLDPIALLQELCLDSNSEILEDLRTQLEPALGKLDSAVTEIVDSAWLNGIDLNTELTALNNLLNYEE